MEGSDLFYQIDYHIVKCKCGLGIINVQDKESDNSIVKMGGCYGFYRVAVKSLEGLPLSEDKLPWSAKNDL